jgi:hypothetical protein
VIRKIIFHGAMALPCFSVPLEMPYATRPPKICAKPLNENQIPVRRPCSFLVYLLPVSSRPQSLQNYHLLIGVRSEVL